MSASIQRFDSLLKQLYKRPRTELAWIVAGLIGAAVPAAAQDYTEIRRLGTSNAVCRGGVEDEAALQRYFADNREDLARVLSHAGWSGAPDDLFRAIAAGDATLAAMPPGTTLE